MSRLLPFLLLTACAPAPIYGADAPYVGKYAAPEASPRPEPRPARLPPPTCRYGFEPKCDGRDRRTPDRIETIRDKTPPKEVECSMWRADTRYANGKPAKDCATVAA